jgi:PhnB protein
VRPQNKNIFRALSQIDLLIRRCIERTKHSRTNKNEIMSDTNKNEIMSDTNTNSNRQVEVYLSFNGACEDAVEFYRKTIGAEVLFTMRHKDSPQPPPPGMLSPGFENKIMHCSFRVGATTIMASDGCGPEKTNFQGFTLSLTVPTEAEADRAFAALSAGGQVKMPLTKTFWSPKFGMLEDRFGVSWMITLPATTGK